MVRFGVLLVALLAAGSTGTKTPPAKPAPSPSPSPTPKPTPSLNDSVTFLREKLETYGGYAFSIAAKEDPSDAGRVEAKNSVSGFDAKTCVMTISRKIDWKTAIEGEDGSEYGETSTITIRVPLKEVQGKVKLLPLPDSFRKAFAVTGGGESLTQVEISAKGQLKPIGVREVRSIRAERKTKSETVNDQIGSTYLVFADTDIAERAADALEHAIALCQRKKEKF